MKKKNQVTNFKLLLALLVTTTTIKHSSAHGNSGLTESHDLKHFCSTNNNAHQAVFDKKVLNAGNMLNLNSSAPSGNCFVQAVGFNSYTEQDGNTVFIAGTYGNPANTVYTWKYQSATIGTGATMKYNFLSNGYYPVKLIEEYTWVDPQDPTNIKHCIDSITNTVVVDRFGCNTHPADFTYTSDNAGNYVFTSDTSAYNAGTRYFWHDDSNTLLGNGNMFNCQFYSNGPHTVTLNITYTFPDPNNPAIQVYCQDSVSKVITVTNAASPCSKLNAKISFQSNNNNSYRFEANTAGNFNNTMYTWYDNGVIISPFNNTALNYQFMTNGLHEIVLTAAVQFTDPLPPHTITSCSKSDTVRFTITGATDPCTLQHARFTYIAGANGNYTFNVDTIGNNALTMYKFKFDNNPAFNLNNVTSVNYSFNTPGMHTVLLTTFYSFENPLNALAMETCIDTSLKVIYIPFPTDSCQNQKAAFTYTNNSTGLFIFQANTNGNNPNTHYQWYINGGVIGQGTNFTHQFHSNGAMKLVLEAAYGYYDSFGNYQYCSKQDSVTINVTGASNPCSSLKAAFTYTHNGAGLYTFVANTAGNNANTSYQWYEYPQYLANGTILKKQFTSNGIHNMYLRVSSLYYDSLHPQNSVICTDSVYVPVQVTGLTTPCNASFTIWKTDSLNPASTGWSAYNNTTGNGPLKYLWSFGDGSNSTLAYPSHTYAVAGHYNICLTITDSTGCSSTFCDSSSVHKTMAGGNMISFTVIQKANGITEKANDLVGMRCFPNPFADVLTVQLNSDKQTLLQLNVLNLMGETVLSNFSTVNKGENEIKLNTGNLENGLYFIQFIGEKGEKLGSIKIVK